MGRPSARGFAGVPQVTGAKQGFFRNNRLELELAVFGGGTEAMTAGSVEVAAGTAARSLGIEARAQ
jgi:hypothetical protein